MSLKNTACPLCHYKETKPLTCFVFCPECHLHFKRPEDRPSLKAEEKRYSEHNNSTKDLNYLNYLDKLFSYLAVESSALGERIKSPLLDFGCGPTKGLEALIKHKKLNEDVHSFDSIYFKKGLVENMKYNRIYASECFEHFTNPYKTISFIASLQNSKGHLAIRTELFESSKVPLEKWWYFKDPTHVCFYTKHTVSWLSKAFNYKIKFLKSPFIVLEKL